MSRPRYVEANEKATALIAACALDGGSTLDLSGLGLRLLPNSLFELTHLNDLDLSGNGISVIPESLSLLEKLRYLNLRENALSFLPDSLVQLTNLEMLGLAQNHFSEIPQSVFSLASLDHLDISDNQIEVIPEALFSLKGLTFLGLASNGISKIPESIAKLESLEDLYLYDNRITKLPDAISNLAKLRYLGLSINRLQGIPQSLSQLLSLEGLDLGFNQIKSLPEALVRLLNLKELELDRNQLKALPEAVAGLKLLEKLDLGDNRLRTIPKSFASLTKLKILYLHGNPELGIPDEILGPSKVEVRSGKQPRAPRSILDYYFAQRQGSAPLNEAKLILVGKGGVGKTSVVKALTTGKFSSREKTTEGIKISDWHCPVGRTQTTTLHIWDFGGQEMMHATHQFFLTARSLYLLVLNRRQGGYDEEVDYWFRLIRAFGGPTAPVIIVLNKQMYEPFDVNRGGWLEKYAGNIKGFVETDCSDRRSITRLKQRIQTQLGALVSLKTSFPSRWFAIKNELATMPTEYVTYDGYRQICANHGETDPDLQAALSGFLHDLGIALNYSHDTRLKFAYVLKPEWVTRGIYSLLHAFVKQKGLFSPGDAEQVLQIKGYSSEAAHFILGLMEHFELSFPLGDPKKRLLIPELLDDRQPTVAGEFKPNDCLNFGYRYQIVPEGLLPRFIARTHHLSISSNRWKSGVIVQHKGGCRALVRADVAAREVRINVDGELDLRRDLLAIVRHNFEVIHSDYQLKPADLVYPQGFQASHSFSMSCRLYGETAKRRCRSLKV